MAACLAVMNTAGSLNWQLRASRRRAVLVSIGPNAASDIAILGGAMTAPNGHVGAESVNPAALVDIADPVHYKLLLVCFTNPKQAWPKLTTLAERAGMSRSTVQKALVQMERLGYLKRRKRFGTSTSIRSQAAFSSRIASSPRKRHSKVQTADPKSEA